MTLTSPGPHPAAIDVLAEFIASVQPRHSEQALQRARHAWIDTIGCMLQGIASDAAKQALAAVSPWGTGNALVVGTDVHLPPPWAALVNGTAAHSSDYDDWDLPSMAHTSAVLVPSLLAAMASERGSGADLLDAYIVGVEVMMCIGEAVNISHYDKGWLATNTIGAIGACAACARVHKLDSAVTANALAAATSMMGGFTCHPGFTLKPTHAGLAAKTGILATSLAQAGTEGNPSALDGGTGFAGLMSDAAMSDFAIPLAKLGEPWGILEHGIYMKLYPSCGGTDTVIEVAQKICLEHAPDPGEISEISVKTSDIIRAVAHYGVPETPDQMRFSLPWCVAIALIDGTVNVASFSPTALERPDVRALAARVQVSEHPRNDGLLFDPAHPDQLTVRMQSGEVYEEEIVFPRGAPSRPANDESVHAKFLDCARQSVSDGQATAVLGILSRKDDNWDIADLVAAVRGSGTRSPL